VLERFFRNSTACSTGATAQRRPVAARVRVGFKISRSTSWAREQAAAEKYILAKLDPSLINGSSEPPASRKPDRKRPRPRACQWEPGSFTFPEKLLYV